MNGLVDYRYAWRWGLVWAFDYVKRGRFVGALRSLWWSFVRGWATEACQEYARPYPLWWCDDGKLYDAITGADDASGLFYHDCFDRMARRKWIELVWRPVDLNTWDCAHENTHGSAREVDGAMPIQDRPVA